MKKIAVFTSGSDAPGMNACIRAVVRSAYYYDIETMGIISGYNGMINGNFIPLDHQSVSNIIQTGGTILKCGQSEAFKSKDERKKAYQNIKNLEIDGLVAIGGNGTFKGADIIYSETGIPCIGVPGTIDNDLYGTDFTIGYDTALNTAVTAIDQLRDTANSHERIFFIEVMGKDKWLAVMSAIAGGAEMTIFSEGDIIHQQLESISTNSLNSYIIIVEGNDSGRAQLISEKVKQVFPKLDTKVTSLGYVQRGGIPSATDRVLAGQLGLGAVEGLMNGKKNHMVGTQNGSICYTPFSELLTNTKPVSDDLIILFDIMKGI